MINDDLPDKPEPLGEEAGEDEDEEEILKVPPGTPIMVNTTSGREMLVKYTEDCYIHATLGGEDDTLKTAEAITSLVLMLANMRFGGLKEARNRWAVMVGAPEVDGS